MSSSFRNLRIPHRTTSTDGTTTKFVNGVTGKPMGKSVTKVGGELPYRVGGTGGARYRNRGAAEHAALKGTK